MERPRRLLRHEFEPDLEVESARMKLYRKSDELFERIMRLKRGTAKKLEAILAFDEHNERVRRLIDAHSGYFKAKRAHLMQFTGIGGIGRAEQPTANKVQYGRRGVVNAAACLLVFLVAGYSGVCFSQERATPDDLAILAVIGEAEGEGYEGMLAVADAIRNRGSLKGVYGMKARRVLAHAYSDDVFKEARRAWSQSYMIDITDGATGWGNSADLRLFMQEAWWGRVEVCAHIGHHWFYRVKGRSYEEEYRKK